MRATAAALPPPAAAAADRGERFRPQASCLRQPQRQAALGNRVALCRQRHPDHLHGRGQTVCRHRRQHRTRQPRPQGQCVCSLSRWGTKPAPCAAWILILGAFRHAGRGSAHLPGPPGRHHSLRRAGRHAGAAGRRRRRYCGNGKLSRPPGPQHRRIAGGVLRAGTFLRPDRPAARLSGLAGRRGRIEPYGTVADTAVVGVLSLEPMATPTGAAATTPTTISGVVMSSALCTDLGGLSSRQGALWQLARRWKSEKARGQDRGGYI